MVHSANKLANEIQVACQIQLPAALAAQALYTLITGCLSSMTVPWDSPELSDIRDYATALGSPLNRLRQESRI